MPGLSGLAHPIRICVVSPSISVVVLWCCSRLATKSSQVVAAFLGQANDQLQRPSIDCEPCDTRLFFHHDLVSVEVIGKLAIVTWVREHGAIKDRQVFTVEVAHRSRE